MMGIGDAADTVFKGKWYPNDKTVRENRAANFSVPKGDDPLWCVVCRKRFKSKGVYDGHLTGKKHIGALKGAGKVKEAEAMKQKIVDDRNRAELSKAQETATAKRSKPAERDEHRERDKKIAKGCFERGFAREGSEAAAAAAAKEDLATRAKPQADPTAAFARRIATDARPNPNGLNWWEGNPTTDEPDDELSALERLMEKKARDRSGKDGPVRSNDWQCPGNFYTKKECGIWNYRDSQKCHNCGATKRADLGM